MFGGGGAGDNYHTTHVQFTLSPSNINHADKHLGWAEINCSSPKADPKRFIDRIKDNTAMVALCCSQADAIRDSS